MQKNRSARRRARKETMNRIGKLFLRGEARADLIGARTRAGVFSGVLGIACNLLLAGAKIALGAVTGMISVLADGINNLTDCGSNTVSLIGFRVSGKPADSEHPFGHRRAEPVAALIVAVLILAVAAELAVQSVQSIFSPQEGGFSLALILVLAAAIAVKLFLFAFNLALARAFGSDALKATATDSLTDCAATAAVLACLFVSHSTGVALDGYAGVLVAVFIAFAGGSVLKETVSKLLGGAPDRETVRRIEDCVLGCGGVRGLHDLTVHSYGSDRVYATVHAEVDETLSLTAAHDLADEIEKRVLAQTGAHLTVHIDPLAYGDERTDRLHACAQRAAAAVDERFRVHDFRVVGGEEHAKLVFEVAIPFDCRLREEEVLSRIRAGITAEEPTADVAAVIERQNVE